jgi:hypothetical protein
LVWSLVAAAPPPRPQRKLIPVRLTLAQLILAQLTPARLTPAQPIPVRLTPVQRNRAVSSLQIAD